MAQLINGELVFYGEPLGQSDIYFLMNMPEGDAWLSLNLDAYDITDDIKSKLKTIQCNKIRISRSELYKSDADGLFFGSRADGDDSEEWLAKRAEIKAKFPWPGSYR